MSDNAHRITDELLSDMEERLTEIYKEAQEGIEKKAAEYFKQFEKLDAQKKKLVARGELTNSEYLQWRQNKIMYDKRWKHLKEQLASELAGVNRTALAYINGQIPEIYALNYNATGEEIADQVKGYSFEMVDAQTVKNLALSDETLLPYKYLDGVKDVRWNTKKVNAAVLQGILQGESIPKMAKRLQHVTEMNRTSAIRNARTSVTSAENKGRYDTYKKAEDDGIKQKLEWIATPDYRTRHSHIFLDGQLTDIGKPFKSELGPIMYPCDPEANPANIYNCRCRMVSHVISAKKIKVTDDNLEYVDRRTAQDFYNEDPKEFDIRQKMLYNKKADTAQFAAYKARLGNEAPKRLADWQNLKYRDKENYQYLTGYYRYKGNNPTSPKEFYDANLTMKRLKSEGEIRTTGTLVAPTQKIKIKSTNAHADERLIERKLTIERAQKIVNNASFAVKQRKGTQYAYYSDQGMAVVNLDGKLGTIGALDKGGKLLYDEVMKHVGKR